MSKQTLYPFNTIATNYINVMDQRPILTEYARPNVMALIPKTMSNLQVLNLGAGTGWFAEQLLKKDAKVTCLDSSQRMLDHTLQRVDHKINAVCADIEKPLDMFQDQQFDYVVAPLVLHYAEDWCSLFTEIVRILKPGGKLVFSIHQPQAEYFIFKLDNYYRKQQITDEWRDIGKVSFYHHTLEELVMSMINNGLCIEQWREPQPPEHMANQDPEMYQLVAKNPWFLFVRAIKLANHNRGKR